MIVRVGSMRLGSVAAGLQLSARLAAMPELFGYGFSRKFRAAFYLFLSLMLCCSFAFGQLQDNTSPNAPSIEISDISTPYDGKVTLAAAVHDKNGHPVAGLKKDSFMLHADGKRIADFSFKQTSEDPLSVIILVDVSGSMKGVPIVEAKKVIAQFMGYLKETDYVSLVTFGAGVNKVIGFTKDKDIINSKVDELRANENKTVLFKSVTEGLKQIASSPTAKSAIVLLTDSKDEHSGIDEADVIAAVRQSTVPVYTIALGKYEYTGFMKRISEISGGQFFLFPKYEDIARLAGAATSRLKAMYMFEFPFSASSGKYTAAIKLNYDGVDISAQKEFTVNVPKESGQPIASAPIYPPKVDEGRPIGNVLLYLLTGLLVVSIILLLTRRPKPHDDNQSSEIKAMSGQLSEQISGQISGVSRQIEDAAGSIKTVIADTQLSLAGVVITQSEQGFTGIEAELSAFKDDIVEMNSALNAALSSEIKAMSGQISGQISDKISAVSRQIEGAVTAMTDSVNGLRRNIEDALQLQYEREFADLKAEISELEGVVSAIISKQIEHSENQSSDAANSLAAAMSINESLCKDNIVAIEKIELRLNEIDVSLTNMDTEIKKYAAAEAESGTAITNKIKAAEEKIAGIPRHIDASIDAMKYGIAALVNTIMDIEKDHRLSPGQTFDKIEGRILQIETSITAMAAEIKAEIGKAAALKSEDGAALPNKIDEIEELRAIEDKISGISRQMEDAVYAVNDSITGMEHRIREVSAAMYGKEIGGMKKEVASVRDALAEVMRFLLVLSE
ncbi:MAG: VWA domain-containing protein [Nitrospirae bacterium]|nr:VWA domain-containing protein [Nitrospirota bacterium]